MGSLQPDHVVSNFAGNMVRQSVREVLRDFSFANMKITCDGGRIGTYLTRKTKFPCVSELSDFLAEARE